MHRFSSRAPLGSLGLLFLAGHLVGAEPPRPLAGSRPNIIIILSDDQGYGDFSRHGNPVLQTPQLDQLAAESIRFTDFHVSPTCAPSRSALLSGKHEFKNGVTHTIFERERMNPATTTLASVLKQTGYATAIFGKWHLGDEPAYQPNRRGFDEVYIHGGGGIGQTYPGSCGDAPGNTYLNPAILHNGRFEKTQGYCTDLFFQHALAWIDSVRGQTPFFCYLATNVPHAPLQVPPGYETRYQGKAPENAARFFAMLANFDDNVGRLRAQLKAWGMDKNTLVIVMNDNGGTFGVSVWNAGMRGAKASPWEGGTRAASFWHWPDRLPPSDISRLAAHLDIFPTLAELAGAKIPAEVQRALDGKSLVSLLENPSAPWPERFLFTHVGRWARGQAAQSEYLKCRVRNSAYSLVCDDPKGAKVWQLFDLKTDYGERHDIAAVHPEIVEAFDRAYDQWWHSIQPDLVNETAIGPTVNPFKALYWQQYGGAPTPELLDEMDPHRTDFKKASG